MNLFAGGESLAQVVAPAPGDLSRTSQKMRADLFVLEVQINADVLQLGHTPALFGDQVAEALAELRFDCVQ